MAEPDTEQLLAQAVAGSAEARDQLLAVYRSRLKRMVAIRMDPRLAARVDPSDVVQEALADAAQKWERYVRQRPIAFYPWLRRLAWERLMKSYRRHIVARRRSVVREERRMRLPDHSAVQLARRIAGSTTGPSAQLRRNELRDQVRSGPARRVLLEDRPSRVVIGGVDVEAQQPRARHLLVGEDLADRAVPRQDDVLVDVDEPQPTATAPARCAISSVMSPVEHPMSRIVACAIATSPNSTSASAIRRPRCRRPSGASVKP